MTDAAVVSVHDVRIGRLERLSDYSDFVFRFDEAWLDDPLRPVLGQLFEDRRPENIQTSGFPCWFANLLPQGASRRLMQRLASLDEETDDDFELLIAMSVDLAGAVSLEPATPTFSGGGRYAEREHVPLRAAGFLLAGAQNKLSVRRGERGLVAPAWGQRGELIAKFYDPRYGDLPRLEFVATEWARLAGLHPHIARLANVDEFEALPGGLETGEGNVFVAERFDRVGSERVHAEDFGQLLDIPPGDPQYKSSYEALAHAIQALCPADAQEYVERVAFMIVSGNGDAHVKNWGVVYPDRRQPRLGPAYDLLPTVCVIPRDGLALTLGDETRFEALAASSFDGLAQAFELHTNTVRRWALESAERAIEAWKSSNANFPLADGERSSLAAHIGRLRLTR